MFISPKAADFDCFMDGKLLPWNDTLGLNLRWLAANRALSASKTDLDEAAEVVTQLAQSGELHVSRNVEVKRRAVVDV